MKNQNCCTLFVLLFFFTALPGAALRAQNLMLFPKRLIFDKGKGVQDVNLTNTDHDTARYTISLIHFRMKEDGTFVEVPADDSLVKSASALVRFYPRSVILAPGESQLVRVQQLRAPALPGEYRSHLYFRSVPKETGDTGQVTTKATQGFAVQLKPVYGISIPIIVRAGDGASEVSLSDASFRMYDTVTPLLSLQVNRAGTFSAYADLVVELLSPDGKTTKVGMMQGIAVYTPIPDRKIKLILLRKEGVDYTKGKLLIHYKSADGVVPVIDTQTEVVLDKTR